MHTCAFTYIKMSVLSMHNYIYMCIYWCIPVNECMDVVKCIQLECIIYVIKCHQIQFINQSQFCTISGLYYKHMMIINYASIVVNKQEALLTDDTRVIIYNRPVFIVQAT